MFRADPREIADIFWMLNESEGDVKRLRSTWSDETQAIIERSRPRHIRIDDLWYDAALQLSGLIYVPKPVSSVAHYSMDPRALAAVRKEVRVRSALVASGERVFEILRRTYREPLLACSAHPPPHLAPLIDRPRPGCRVTFGLDGVSGRRGRPIDGAFGVMLTPLRGPGSAAHLTLAAVAAHARERTQLDVSRWLDRLGSRVCAGQATPGEFDVAAEVRRQATALVYGEQGALHAYRAAGVRVPERVRRAARMRLSA